MGSGPGLLTRFLGESEPEGFGSSMVNSDSEDLKRIGRVASDKFPSLTHAPQIGWICSSPGQMQPLAQLRWPPFPSRITSCPCLQPSHSTRPSDVQSLEPLTQGHPSSAPNPPLQCSCSFFLSCYPHSSPSPRPPALVTLSFFHAALHRLSFALRMSISPPRSHPFLLTLFRGCRPQQLPHSASL